MQTKPRRKLIVNREVQYDVLMHVGLFVGALFLVQAGTAYLYLHQVQKVVGSMSALEFISRYKISFLVYQSISVTICMLVGVYFLNRLTSRIAGPLYNMKRILRKAQHDASGNLDIKLRDGDYFQEEMEDVNVILKKRAK